MPPAPSPARLGRASLPAAASLRPPATCGGSAAGTVPPRQLRGAAKPQKCALNKPAPLNEDSSCPIKSEASLSSATPRRDRTGVPGWDAAPARGDEDVLVGTQGFHWLWSPMLHKGTASLPVVGKAAERENPREKTKGHSSTFLGASPTRASRHSSAGCSPELLGDDNHWDEPHKDLGFWFAALWSVAQGGADPALLRERSTRLPGAAGLGALPHFTEPRGL